MGTYNQNLPIVASMPKHVPSNMPGAAPQSRASASRPSLQSRTSTHRPCFQSMSSGRRNTTTAPMGTPMYARTPERQRHRSRMKTPSAVGSTTIQRKTTTQQRKNTTHQRKNTTHQNSRSPSRQNIRSPTRPALQPTLLVKRKHRKEKSQRRPTSICYRATHLTLYVSLTSNSASQPFRQ